MPTINVKVDDKTKAAVWKKATSVPQRTVSDWVRELIEAALKKPVKMPDRGEGE